MIQKPRYLPNINLVWASTAGSEPKSIMVMGNISHCIETAGKEKQDIERIQIYTSELISYMDHVEIVYK